MQWLIKHGLNRLLVIVLGGLAGLKSDAQELPSQITFDRDAINRVAIDCNGRVAIVYARPQSNSTGAQESGIDWLLLTHGRRDVVCAAESSALIANQVFAPAAERLMFDEPHSFWQAQFSNRFSDYAQRSTKVRAKPMRVTQFVGADDVVECDEVHFRVIETPGFTAGAVSYAVDLEGKRIGFVGDLILGDGQILDLYSFQDAIHEAKIRGYHGYGSRLAELMTSLRRIRNEEFDFLVPARGPIISEPNKSIDRLIARVESLVRNYLSTTALHWYFGADNMTLVGQRVLGAEAVINLMPFAEHAPAPEWVWAFATTRLVLSKSGKAFMLDCWNEPALDAVQSLIDDGTILGVDGIFVTHYHDDHTAMVQKAAKVFSCPVYCVAQYHDVLKNPGSYHLPCVSANAIKELQVRQDGDQLEWEEYRFTFRYFPGQTFYHGALHVVPNDGPSVFFVGDSFAPSGFDDYCVQNRNLLHEDSGYLLCLKTLRRYGPKQWLINQHIPRAFRFSTEELDYLESHYRERIEIQRSLYFWDDPSYGVDENWAACYPYAQQASPGTEKEIEIRITNHSEFAREFKVRLNSPVAIDAESTESQPDDSEFKSLRIASRMTGSFTYTLEVPDARGMFLITADIESDGIALKQWAEGLIVVD